MSTSVRTTSSVLTEARHCLQGDTTVEASLTVEQVSSAAVTLTAGEAQCLCAGSRLRLVCTALAISNLSLFSDRHCHCHFPPRASQCQPGRITSAWRGTNFHEQRKGLGVTERMVISLAGRASMVLTFLVAVTCLGAEEEGVFWLTVFRDSPLWWRRHSSGRLLVYIWWQNQ